jgi:hypothetical protein
VVPNPAAAAMLTEGVFTYPDPPLVISSERTVPNPEIIAVAAAATRSSCSTTNISCLLYGIFLF